MANPVDQTMPNSVFVLYVYVVVVGAYTKRSISRSTREWWQRKTMSLTRYYFADRKNRTTQRSLFLCNAHTLQIPRIDTISFSFLLHFRSVPPSFEFNRHVLLQSSAIIIQLKCINRIIAVDVWALPIRFVPFYVSLPLTRSPRAPPMMLQPTMPMVMVCAHRSIHAFVRARSVRVCAECVPRKHEDFIWRSGEFVLSSISMRGIFR